MNQTKVANVSDRARAIHRQIRQDGMSTREAAKFYGVSINRVYQILVDVDAAIAFERCRRSVQR